MNDPYIITALILTYLVAIYLSYLIIVFLGMRDSDPAPVIIVFWPIAIPIILFLFMFCTIYDKAANGKLTKRVEKLGKKFRNEN